MDEPKKRAAGYPSPADDFKEDTLDLNKYLILRPNSTFFGDLQGNSMKDAGLLPGDKLVIDKSVKPAHGHIAVCSFDGHFMIKRIDVRNGELWLIEENDKALPVQVKEGSELKIWGIVVGLARKIKP